MKTIKQIDLTGVKELTPMEMNSIHFDTGERSQLINDTSTSGESSGTSSKSDAVPGASISGKPGKKASLRDI